jgi:hypothetical protein
MRSGGCYDRRMSADISGQTPPDELDPLEPHGFLAADTFVPLGPYNGRGAAIRGLMTPEAVVTARADRCALCGRPSEDAIHIFGD